MREGSGPFVATREPIILRVLLDELVAYAPHAAKPPATLSVKWVAKTPEAQAAALLAGHTTDNATGKLLFAGKDYRLLPRFTPCSRRLPSVASSRPLPPCLKLRNGRSICRLESASGKC